MPLTVKIRLGWDPSRKNFLETAAAVREGGASALFVHGRTRAEMYSGTADWESIAAVASCLDIPVIGNGDIADAATAAKRLAESGCYGIMVGRGAVGNPFLFREISAHLQGKAPPPSPTRKERIDTALRHLRAAIADKGEGIAVRECRKQIAAYTHGMPGAAATRAAVNAALTYAEIEAILLSLLK
jgi:nifR3 family TIM-barrel protein